MSRSIRVLFVVEGNTDIRFVSGLSEICDLSLVVPARNYQSSGLEQRICDAGLRVNIDTLPGNRFSYQLQSLRYLWENAGKYDLILSQELLRGTLSCNVVGKLRGVPVVAFMAMPPLEYFRCRRLRGQHGWLKAAVGESVIRSLLALNGRLVSLCVALGPYLIEVAGRDCSRVVAGYYYGVDTDLYRPAGREEVRELRRKLGLPVEKFLILSASRVSHEKDPETVLKAVSIARQSGLDAVVMSLSGGRQEYLRLCEQHFGQDGLKWVIARDAAHPMGELADYYRAADCLVQASLEEGAGMAPLEALACAVPAVCTAVGGLARILPGYARLVGRQDAEAMATEFLWVAGNPAAARQQALAGRQFVMEGWSRSRAFGELQRVLVSVRNVDQEKSKCTSQN